MAGKSKIKKLYNLEQYTYTNVHMYMRTVLCIYLYSINAWK